MEGLVCLEFADRKPRTKRKPWADQSSHGFFDAKAVGAKACTAFLLPTRRRR